MSAKFPQVTQWEVGNEWNTSDFLNVYPDDAAPLTDVERMEIATDMMYYASFSRPWCKGNTFS